MTLDLSIVLPCFNEQDALPDVLSRLRGILTQFEAAGVAVEVIVVDDGSTDGSEEVISSFADFRLVRLRRRSGYGQALKSGFALAQGAWVAFFDPDRTYHPEDLIPMYALATGSGPDLVFGCRSFVNPGMPLVRSWGNRFFVGICRMFFGDQIRDTSTGFRMFRRARLNEVLSLGSEGFAFTMQFTMLAVHQRWRIEQIPIRYDYRLGSSKLRPVRDGLRFLLVIFRYRCRGGGRQIC